MIGAWSVTLVVEYESVIPKHAAPLLPRADVTTLNPFLCLVGVPQRVFFLWPPLLRATNDDMVAEVAVARRPKTIVTPDSRDVGAVSRFGVASTDEPRRSR
jgi:hypothetical protein